MVFYAIAWMAVLSSQIKWTELTLQSPKSRSMAGIKKQNGNFGVDPSIEPAEHLI
jgi:hypothetical protein